MAVRARGARRTMDRRRRWHLSGGALGLPINARATGEVTEIFPLFTGGRGSIFLSFY